MDFEKQKKFLTSFAFYGIIAIGAFLALKYLISPLMPFVIGFAVALLLRMPSVWLTKKFRLPKKLASIVLTAAVYALVIDLLIILGRQVGSTLGSVLPGLPELVKNQVLPFIKRTVEILKDFLVQFDVAAASQIDEWFVELSNSIVSSITSFSTTALKFVSSIAAAMPNIILKVVLTVISTFYFSVDFERIMAFFKKLLPEKIQGGLAALKAKGLHSLGIFVRSYILVFFMTFLELSLGFLILRLPYPALLGIVIAIVDILPVLGTGLILLPWAVVCLLMKNFFLGIGLLLLYVVITVIRNIVEPKLVGEQIGLHPLATLISMFLGLQLFGLLGLFLLPVTLSIVVQFRKDWVNEKNATPEIEPDKGTE